MTSRKHRSRTHRTPTPTTSAKWTGVRDPRAAVRFSLDDRVIWDRGDGTVIIGTIVGFADDTLAQVRLEDGRLVGWPTFTPRMRRICIPDPDEDIDDGGTMTESNPAVTPAELAPLVPNPMEESYYAAVTVATEASARDGQNRTVPDFVEFEATYPSDKTRGDE